MPAKTLAQFIALAKSKPGALRYGSAGQGNITHLAGELFKNAAAVDLLHVPYKGSGPALIDLIGGQIHAMFANMAAGAAPYPLRQSARDRLDRAEARRRRRRTCRPSQSSASRYEVTGWFGLLAPKGTPREIVAKLSSAMVKVLRSPGDRGTPEPGKPRRGRQHARAVRDVPGRRRQAMGESDRRFRARKRTESRRYVPCNHTSSAVVKDRQSSSLEDII